MPILNDRIGIFVDFKGFNVVILCKSHYFCINNLLDKYNYFVL